jgi:hypothetical protein
MIFEMTTDRQPQGVEIFTPAFEPDVKPRGEYVRRRLLGGISLLLAILSGVADALAIGLAVERNDEVSTIFVIVAICTSILAFCIGIVALVTGRGRLAGAIGIVLAVLTNPLSLIAILEFFARFTSN